MQQSSAMLHKASMEVWFPADAEIPAQQSQMRYRKMQSLWDWRDNT